MRSISKHCLATLAIATLVQPTASVLARHHIPLIAQAMASQKKAAKAALMRVPKGKIKSAKLEATHGKLIWCFDISMHKTRNITEVKVNAKTGEIVSTQVETPQDQSREAAAEPKEREARVIYRAP
jgi:uncharacterized membrane protein YkoI